MTEVKMIGKLLEIALEDREVSDTCALMDSDKDLGITAIQYKGIEGWFYSDSNSEYWIDDISQSWDDIKENSIWQRNI